MKPINICGLVIMSELQFLKAIELGKALALATDREERTKREEERMLRVKEYDDIIAKWKEWIEVGDYFNFLEVKFCVKKINESGITVLYKTTDGCIRENHFSNDMLPILRGAQNGLDTGNINSGS